MRFTLMGERVDGPKTACKKHGALLPNINADMCKGKGASPCWRLLDKQSSWECEGATMKDRDGYPSCHEAMGNLLVHYMNSASIIVARSQERKPCRRLPAQRLLTSNHPM